MPFTKYILNKLKAHLHAHHNKNNADALSKDYYQMLLAEKERLLREIQPYLDESHQLVQETTIAASSRQDIKTVHAYSKRSDELYKKTQKILDALRKIDQQIQAYEQAHRQQQSMNAHNSSPAPKESKYSTQEPQIEKIKPKPREKHKNHADHKDRTSKPSIPSEYKEDRTSMFNPLENPAYYYMFFNNDNNQDHCRNDNPVSNCEQNNYSNCEQNNYSTPDYSGNSSSFFNNSCETNHSTSNASYEVDHSSFSANDTSCSFSNDNQSFSFGNN